jgi:hypothetical protein
MRRAVDDLDDVLVGAPNPRYVLRVGRGHEGLAGLPEQSGEELTPRRVELRHDVVQKHQRLAVS